MLKNLKRTRPCFIFALSLKGETIPAEGSSLNCGVMKLLADMPSRLEGGDHRIN